MFYSILFKDKGRKKLEDVEFFRDLNLDQMINSLTSLKKEYNLNEFFYVFPSSVEETKYRQDISRDLENEEVFHSVREFSMKMQRSRKYQNYANKLTYKYQKERWFVDSARVYVEAVNTLKMDLSSLKINSEGFKEFKRYLNEYVNSETFKDLASQVSSILDELSAIEYTIFIKENTIKVQKYKGEKDYAEEVLKTFERFKQTSVKDYNVEFDEFMEMNHVEAKILDLVAKLYSHEFSELDLFYVKYASYMDKMIVRFEREVQFYISYLEYVKPLKESGLKFCYPEFTTSKQVYASEAFDVVLAKKMQNEGSTIICNDFHLNKKERILVVTGPNQGGKTTFARMIGQIHYLARMGYPVPAKKARLMFFDKILSHFEREERTENLRGKLEDDLIRIKKILDAATPSSIVLMNEIFSSTTLDDALFLTKKVVERIIESDSLAVLVTFLYEISSMNDKVVSMVSTVSQENPEIRTYKIVRMPSNGISYAISLARKYGLTYVQLMERIDV